MSGELLEAYNRNTVFKKLMMAPDKVIMARNVNGVIARSRFPKFQSSWNHRHLMSKE